MMCIKKEFSRVDKSRNQQRICGLTIHSSNSDIYLFEHLSMSNKLLHCKIKFIIIHQHGSRRNTHIASIVFGYFGYMIRMRS